MDNAVLKTLKRRILSLKDYFAKSIAVTDPEPIRQLENVEYDPSTRVKPPKLHKQEVKIFVSSTFIDMKREREVLATSVFPQLKQLCKQLNIPFSYVDLRWGITDEEVRDGQVLYRCLKEVSNCYPFFISMIGERYGWHQILDEDEVLQNGFDYAVQRKIGWLNDLRDRSVTELEMINGFLKYYDVDLGVRDKKIDFG